MSAAVSAVERGRIQLAVDADERDVPDLEVEVARPPFDRVPEQLVDVHAGLVAPVSHRPGRPPPRGRSEHTSVAVAAHLSAQPRIARDGVDRMVELRTAGRDDGAGDVGGANPPNQAPPPRPRRTTRRRLRAARRPRRRSSPPRKATVSGVRNLARRPRHGPRPQGGLGRRRRLPADGRRDRGRPRLAPDAARRARVGPGQGRDRGGREPRGGGRPRGARGDGPHRRDRGRPWARRSTSTSGRTSGSARPSTSS